MNEMARLGRLGEQLFAGAKTDFIDGGTTNLKLVTALPNATNTHTFKHSPTMAAALERHSVRVTVIGDDCTNIQWLQQAQSL